MERNMTNPVNDNLMQIARPSSHDHAATPAETQRLEDSGGVSFRDERRPAMSLINVFVAVRNALIGGRRRRRDYDQLMALDDRSLADIGMHRSQLPAIVEATYRCAELRPVAAPALSPHAPIEHARGWVDGHRSKILRRRGLTVVS
jgi:uncharacterized protein YjiS (DUF1127 family)